MMPPLLLASHDFSYQIVVANNFAVKSMTWLVVTDRFSGWLSLLYYSKEASALELIKNLTDYFATFGIVGCQYTIAHHRQQAVSDGIFVQTLIYDNFEDDHEDWTSLYFSPL